MGQTDPVGPRPPRWFAALAAAVLYATLLYLILAGDVINKDSILSETILAIVFLLGGVLAVAGGGPSMQGAVSRVIGFITGFKRR